MNLPAYIYARMSWLAGLGLCVLLATVAHAVSRLGFIGHFGIGPLTLAILIGALLGNGLRASLRERLTPGVLLAQGRVLRVGVALYGFNLSVQQIIGVGSRALLTDLLMTGSTLLVGWLVGTRWLKLDAHTVILTSAGSAICGAAAILATEPVIGAQPHKTSAAVGAVVLFGTLAMLLYPYLQTVVGWPAQMFGVYVGATVHEVAQVVAIGNAVGGGAEDAAVIVKMLRVMMLAPFLFCLGLLMRIRGAGGGSVRVPWFALGFVAVAGFNSLHLCSPAQSEALRAIDTLLLTIAMVALGLETRLARIREAGSGALWLGAILFLQLVVGGAAVVWLLG